MEIKTRIKRDRLAKLRAAYLASGFNAEEIDFELRNQNPGSALALAILDLFWS